MNVTDFETKYRDLVAGVTALADEWQRGIPCACGHSLDTHNGYGCYERLSYEPLVKCDCTLTDDRHDGQLASIILRALLASSPAEGPETVRCAWCVNDAIGTASWSDGARYPSCLMPDHGWEQRKEPTMAASSPAEREGEPWYAEHLPADDAEAEAQRQARMPTPDPVSSGEAGGDDRISDHPFSHDWNPGCGECGEPVQRHTHTEVLPDLRTTPFVMDEVKVVPVTPDAHWPSRPAPVVTPNPEGSETEHDDRCESEFVPEAGAWTPCACGSRITPSTEGAETDG